MLNLDNITLVAISSVRIEATIKALLYSCKDIKFNKIKLISHEKPKDLPSIISYDKCSKINDINQWNRSVIYELPQHIDTEYCILIHDNGFIVNPDSWRNEFLNYDYIGAPWPLPNDNFSYRDKNNNIIRVGNSVSLRSKKLLDIPNKLNLEWKSYHGYSNEDGYICVNNKHIYIENGCKFAGIEIAKYFSHESMIPEIQNIKPFAFHNYYGSNIIYPKFVK